MSEYRFCRSFPLRMDTPQRNIPRRIPFPRSIFIPIPIPISLLPPKDVFVEIVRHRRAPLCTQVQPIGIKRRRRSPPRVEEMTDHRHPRVRARVRVRVRVRARVTIIRVRCRRCRRCRRRRGRVSSSSRGPSTSFVQAVDRLHARVVVEGSSFRRTVGDQVRITLPSRLGVG